MKALLLKAFDKATQRLIKGGRLVMSRQLFRLGGCDHAGKGFCSALLAVAEACKKGKSIYEIEKDKALKFLLNKKECVFYLVIKEQIVNVRVVK